MNEPENSAQDTDRPWPNFSYALMVLVLLTAAYALSFVDRQVLTLMVEDVKADLHVNDTAMGLLTGFSFSLFYVVLGLPLARLMDSTVRRNVIAGCIGLWSLMTAFCGMARSFPVLFLARMGVGCGEAGISPGSASLLADYFPKRLLPSAMGVYSMGIYFGQGIALIVGGILLAWLAGLGPQTIPLLGAVKPWQMVFFVYGIPGILLALLFLLIREPPRRKAAGGITAADRIPIKDVAAYLRRNWMAYAGIIIGFSLMILVGNGTSSWIPTFFIRKFHWTVEEIGARYGTLVILCGATGTFCGGLCATLLRKFGMSTGNLVASLIGFVILVPLTVVFPLVSDGWTSLTLIGVMNFFAGFPFGGGIASLLEITPNAMRAQVAALYSLFVNLLGQGVGPLFIGSLTDYVFHDPAHLPQAIALTSAVFSPLAVVFLLIGFKGYAKTMKAQA